MSRALRSSSSIPTSATASWQLACVCVCLLSGAVACGPDPAAEQRQADRKQIDAVIKEGRSHEDPFVRAETIRMLSFGPAGSWEADAEAMLDDPSPLVAFAAADALLRKGESEAAVNFLRTRMKGDDEAQVLAALDIGLRHLAYAGRMELIDLGMQAASPLTRRSAFKGLLGVLERGEAPETRIARDLERRVVSHTTDKDIPVAIAALSYLGSVSRLVSENQDARSALAKVARSGEQKDRVRALRILTGLKDSRLGSLAFDAYREAGDDASRADLREAGILAIGASGDASMIGELDKLARLDAEPERQFAALDALVGVDDPGAVASLNQALDNPHVEVRRFVLSIAGPKLAELRISDDLLKDPDMDVRVAALAALYKQSPKRFTRLVTQKLEVEQFRAALLAGLAAWAEDEKVVPGEAPPWLASLAESLYTLREQFGNQDDIGAALYSLLILLDEPRTYLAELEKVPATGKYAVLRAALEQESGSSEASRTGLYNRHFAVRLVSAVGLLRGK